jgi:ATP-dependent Clp protease ATP-binding subunit ClpC
LAWHHAYLGCEHLLIGLLIASDCAAASILSKLKLDLAQTRAMMTDLVRPGREAVTRRRLPKTRRARQVLNAYALQEARILHHHYLGTEHVLLALLRDPENMAAKLLSSLGIQPDQVRKAVLAYVLPGQ